MTNKLISMLMIAFFTLSISAQEKLSLQSRVKINNHKSLRNKITTKSLDDSNSFTQAFITLNEDTKIEDLNLDSLNITILNEVGNIAIVSIPFDKIEALEKIDAIEYIEIEQTAKMLCDSARSATKINEVHNGYNLPQSFKGKDVVVGIIDCGIDYNHINFKDKNKNFRVKKAGIIKNNTIQVYNDSVSISKLTTDYTNESHGTHVAGIAAGSYSKNNLHGVAPESDLLLYGLGTKLTSTNLITAVSDIFNYARTQNKPAVINISLGTNIGSHDGTDSFNRALDNLSKEGNIIVVASGNEGEDNLYIKHNFIAEDSTSTEVATIIDSGSTKYYCEVDAWSHDSNPFGIQLFIYDTSTKKELTKSVILHPISTSYTEFTWDGLATTNYFSGSVTVAGQKSSLNNRYQYYTLINATTKQSNYRIGIRFISKKDATVEAWTNQAEFTNYNNPKYIKGSPDGSFNDMATGNETICIGAYSTKKRFTTITGTRLHYPDATEGDIASFSSYGTDINGRNYPDVVAPGFTVVSSVNEHDKSTISARQYLIDEVNFLGDSRSYHWGDMAGTSMATPVATGTIALWLQADPTLTAAEIKEILTKTATTDAYTKTGNPIKWGAGKLNAYAGLVHILQGNSAITDVESHNKAFMIYPNPSNGNFSLYAHNEESINLNIYSLNGSVVYSNTINTDNGLANVYLEGSLIPGIYIVNVKGKFTTHSSRLIIK